MSTYKAYYSFTIIIMVSASVLLLSSCGTDEEPDTITTITTTAVTDVTLTTLKTGGTIEAPSKANITTRGVVWSNSSMPTLEKSASTNDGAGTGTFQSELTGLNFQQYYMRAYVIANKKVYYGNEIVFNHAAIIPKLSTQPPTEVTLNSAKVQTTVMYNWSEPILEKGICWGTVMAPTIDKHPKIEVTDPALQFSVTLNNVNPGQIYYARAYVITPLDIFYGNTVSIFILPPPVFGEVTDIDGNKYKTVVVGNKTWMAQNLAVTKFNDGTAIPTQQISSDFKNTNAAALTAYAGDLSNAATYGYLYNGYVINSSKNICMTGWRVPDSDDWSQLATALGGIDVAGGRMKEVSGLWQTPNVSATNESGFAAIPGGSFCSVCLSNTGVFADQGTDGYWWSIQTGDFFYVTNDRADLRTKSTAVTNDGLSIRCIKN